MTYGTNDPESSMNSTLQKLARPLELILAAIFAAGVVLKALDINVFAVQIASYGVVSETSLLARTALAVLGLEAFLAVLLLLGTRARTLLYVVVQALLAVFTALIVYGWAFHGLEDCGCFGPLKLSPGLSIAKNLVMMCLVAAAWWGFRCRGSAGWARLDAVWKGTVAAVVALGLVIGVSTTLDKVKSTTPTPFAQFVVTTDAGRFELGSGEYLVALLSTGCDHCREEVPELNALVSYPGLPPLVALCYEELDGQLGEFRTLTQPEFPMHGLGSKSLLFFDLLGDAREPPRLVFVRNGAAVTAWNGQVPEPAVVAEAVRTTSVQ